VEDSEGCCDEGFEGGCHPHLLDAPQAG
jgi:hypothetical protein